MNKLLRNMLLVAGLLAAGSAAAEITLFENDGFNGRSVSADRPVWNLERWGFNDTASSAVVRGGTYEVCTDARFSGRCVILRPGDYPSLGAMGLNDRVSSVREVNNNYGRDDRYRSYDRDYRYRHDDDRYDYRNDGWRFDRFENRWERY